MGLQSLEISRTLSDVRYEIRGRLASRAHELEKRGYEILFFIRLHPRFDDVLDDQTFALELLETKHVLVAPGSSFNTLHTDHFRITTLPDTNMLQDVFERTGDLLDQHA